jgi:tyrosyl-tRNA synthetase
VKNVIEDSEKIEEILTRGVAEVIDREHLKKRLLADEKLRVKLGVDPTSPYLHIGRAVTLLKMRDLQELGHQIVFLVGDFTGIIGDTSDKDSERPMLTKEVVEKNMETYKGQAGKILDMSKVEFHHNSEWLAKLGYGEIGEQADQFSLSGFIARENIKKRLKKGARISLRELLYPLMQGYDSVALKADLELGGTDQRFNLLAGRELQKHYGQEPQDILMVNLIEGTDGRKMSSSWGNTVNLTDQPDDMFGKIMSIPDELIIKYFIHCTRVSMKIVKKREVDMKSGVMNPRDAKLELAMEIVRIYHGEKIAKSAQENFVNVFQKKEAPEKIRSVNIRGGKIKLTEFLVKSDMAVSLGDARRKIEQGGVSVEGEKILDYKLELSKKDYDNKVIKAGKFHFIKVIFK